MDVSAEATTTHSGSSSEGRRPRSREAEKTEKHPLRLKVVGGGGGVSAVHMKHTRKHPVYKYKGTI